VEKQRKEPGFNEAAARQKAEEKFEKNSFELQFRSNHSLESAIHALRDRETIAGVGVSPDEVALGCLVHSKSNSGLRSIESEEQWRIAVDRLQTRVKEYNEVHPEEPITFDTSFLMNEDGSFKQDKLAQMRTEATILRIGDANGHDELSRTSQNGKEIEFSLEKKEATEPLPEAQIQKLKEEKKDGQAEILREVQSADVKVDGEELNNHNDPEGVARMFAVGEGNFQSLRCEVGEDGKIREVITLCDGDAFPLSTQHCIKERIGEFQTANPMECEVCINLGPGCDEKTIESYTDFAERYSKIDSTNNVIVRVVTE
jgi:hypothetical protein